MRHFVLILAMLAAFPARATPPDMISLHDRVIGYNESQVFILRETSDNLGRHIYGLHDVYLVAKNLTSGLEEEIWPVYRMYMGEEMPAQTEDFRLQNAVNPFEILITRAAIYVGRDFLLTGLNRDETGEFNDGLSVNGAPLAPSFILAQIDQSIKLTANAIQPYPQGDYRAMTFHTPQELLEEMNYTAEECTIAGLKTLFRYPLENTRLARVQCESDEGQQVTLVIVLPEPL